MENTAAKLAVVKQPSHVAIDDQIDRYESTLGELDLFIRKITGGGIDEDKQCNPKCQPSLHSFLIEAPDRMSNLNERLSSLINELDSKLF